MSVEWDSHADRTTVADTDEILVKVGAVWFTMSKKDFTSGIVPSTDLETTGTKDNTTFLRGDDVYAVPPGGGGATDHGALTGLTDDDHTQYQLRTEKNAVSGYAGLEADSKVLGAQQRYGAIADTAAQGNDARLSDQRIPTDNSVTDAKVTTHTTTKISTLNKALLNTEIAYKDQANVYPAGNKQTVSHSATVAGLNFGPVAGDPSAAVDGDVWYNLTTNKYRGRENGVNVDLAGGGSGGDLGYTVLVSTGDLVKTTVTVEVIPGLAFTPDPNSTYEGYVDLLCLADAGGGGRINFSGPTGITGAKANDNEANVDLETEDGITGITIGTINKVRTKFAFQTTGTVDADFQTLAAQLGAVGTTTFLTGCRLFYRKV